MCKHFTQTQIKPVKVIQKNNYCYYQLIIVCDKGKERLNLWKYWKVGKKKLLYHIICTPYFTYKKKKTEKKRKTKKKRKKKTGHEVRSEYTNECNQLLYH